MPPLFDPSSIVLIHVRPSFWCSMRGYVIASGVPSRFSGGNSSSGRIFSKRDLISAVVRVLATSQHHPDVAFVKDLRVVSHVIDTIHV